MRALEQMRKLDDLDELVKVARARAWVAVVVLGSVVVAAVVWGFFGAIPNQVLVGGVLSYPHGVATVQSTVVGQVVSITPQPGTDVAPGQQIAVVRRLDGTRVTVRSPLRGVVVGVSSSVGAVIGIGTPLLAVERMRLGDQLVALAFVPADQAARVAPGMAASVEVSSAPAAAFGALEGRVETVGTFPLSPAEVDGLLGNPALDPEVVLGSPPVLVTIRLTPDRATVSGFRWSTPKGPPFRLQPQALLSASIATGTQRPISLVFGG